MLGASLVGELSLCYTIEGLMLDSVCDTPHVQVTIVALQLSSKVAGSVIQYPRVQLEAPQL